MLETAEEREAKIRSAKKKLKKFQAARSHAEITETSSSTHATSTPTQTLAILPVNQPIINGTVIATIIKDASSTAMKTTGSADILYGGIVDSYYNLQQAATTRLLPPPVTTTTLVSPGLPSYAKPVLVLPPSPTQFINHTKKRWGSMGSIGSMDELAIVGSYETGGPGNSRVPSESGEPEPSIPPHPLKYPKDTSPPIQTRSTQTILGVLDDNILIELRARVAAVESHLVGANAKLEGSKAMNVDLTRRLAGSEQLLESISQKFARDVAESRKVVEIALAERVDTTKALEESKAEKEAFRKKVILLQKMLDEEMSERNKARSRDADSHFSAALKARQEAEVILQKAQNDSLAQTEALRIEGAEAVAAMKNEVIAEWEKATQAREEAERLLEEIKLERQQNNTASPNQEPSFNQERKKELEALEAQLQRRQTDIELAEAAINERHLIITKLAENAEKELNAALEKSNQAIRSQSEAMLLKQNADAEIKKALQIQQELETERSVVIAAAEQERIQLQTERDSLSAREFAVSELEAKMKSTNRHETDPQRNSPSLKSSIMDDSGFANVAAALRRVEAEKNALERERAALDLRESQIATREKHLAEHLGITEFGGNIGSRLTSPVRHMSRPMVAFPPRPTSPQTFPPASPGIIAELPRLREDTGNFEPVLQQEGKGVNNNLEALMAKCVELERENKHFRVTVLRLTEMLEIARRSKTNGRNNTSSTVATGNLSPTISTLSSITPTSPTRQAPPLFPGTSIKNIEKRIVRLEEANNIVEQRIDGLELDVKHVKTVSDISTTSVNEKVDLNNVTAKDRKWTPEEAKLLQDIAAEELLKADIEKLVKHKMGYDLLNVIVALTSANQSLSAKLSTLTATSPPARSILNEILNTSPNVQKSTLSPRHNAGFLPVKIESVDEPLNLKPKPETDELVAVNSPPIAVVEVIVNSPRGRSAIRKASLEAATREDSSPINTENSILKEASPTRLDDLTKDIAASGIADDRRDRSASPVNKSATLNTATNTLSIAHLVSPLEYKSRSNISMDSTCSIDDGDTPRQSQINTPRASTYTRPTNENLVESSDLKEVKKRSDSPASLNVALPSSTSKKKRSYDNFNGVRRSNNNLISNARSADALAEFFSETDLTGFSEGTRKILLGTNSTHNYTNSNGRELGGSRKNLGVIGSTNPVIPFKSKLNANEEKQNFRQLIKERVKEKAKS